MRTALVILNWNTRDHLKRWVPGLLAGNADLWVADNASTDGSLEMLSAEFPKVKTISFDRNYGFTGGYNKALEIILDQMDYEYVVLVNSDIDAPPGWVEPLERWMDSHPECGVCGPKILAMGDGYSRTDRFEYAGAAGGLMDRYGYPYCRGRTLSHTETDSGQYDTPENVLWISGACMMTRARLWQELGGLDDRFFAHMEEIDYCWRAQLSGWKVTIVPESHVWHLGGGTLPQTSPFKLKLNFRNNILLLENNLEPTFLSMGMGRHRASLKAWFMIKERKCLDLCSAIVYLASGHKDSFKAVLQARKEAGRLTRKGKSGHGSFGKPDGLMMNTSILIKHFLKHENSYSRSR